MTRVRRTTRLRSMAPAIAAAAVGLGLLAAAEHQPTPDSSLPADAWAALGRMPATTDLAVLVESPADQVETGPGRVLMAGLGASGLFDRTTEAWNGLAQTLRLDPESAFEQIFGRRAIVLLSGLADTDAPAEWVIVTEVAEDTGADLTARLKAVPRDIRLGVQVRAIESGSYRMALLGSGESRLALLAPDDSSDLFEATLENLRLRGETDAGRIKDDPGYELIASLDAGEAVAVWSPDRGGFMAVSAARAADGWSARVIGARDDGSTLADAGVIENGSFDLSGLAALSRLGTMAALASAGRVGWSTTDPEDCSCFETEITIDLPDPEEPRG